MIDNATIHDIGALVKLEDDCFQGDKLSTQHFRYLLTKANSHIWVYRHYHQIIAAAIILLRKNSAKARLYSFAVHPDYQGKGIAAALLTRVEQDSAKNNYHAIILEVREDNLAAIRFYQKHGYQAFGRYSSYYEDNRDAIRMQKRLSAVLSKDIHGN